MYSIPTCILFTTALNYEGTPQPYNEIKSHVKKNMASRSKPHLTKSEWKKHIDSLKGMSILAHQASEYEYNKQRTEGKTGIVKPDLIPFSSMENLTISPINASTPIPKSPISPQTTEAPIEVLTSPKRKRSTITNSLPIKTHVETSPSQSPKKVTLTMMPPKKLFTETTSPTKEVINAPPKLNFTETPKKLTVPRTVPKQTKPPNILIYSSDTSIFDATLKTFKDVLEPDM